MTYLFHWHKGNAHGTVEITSPEMVGFTDNYIWVETINHGKIRLSKDNTWHITPESLTEDR